MSLFDEPFVHAHRELLRDCSIVIGKRTAEKSREQQRTAEDGREQQRITHTRR
jgi:hypothetical protein